MDGARTNRLDFLDVVRGLAAILVVIQHVFYYQSPAIARFFTDVLNPGRVGVVTFFLVSGFVIPMSLERVTDMRKFWLGRITRIFPAYWVSMYAYIALFLLGYRLHSDADMSSIRVYLANFFMLQTPSKTPDINSVTWTLFLEWVIYAVAAFKVTRLKETPGHKVIGGFLAVSVVVGILLPLAVHARIPAGAFACLLSGMSGYAFYLYTRGQLGKRATAGWMTGLVAVTTAIAFVNYQLFPSVGNELQPGAFNATLSLLGGYALFFAVYKFRSLRFPRPILWLGTVSYSLYLTHTLAIILTEPLAATPALAALQLIGSGVLAWLGYTFVEKPGVKFGKKLAELTFSPKPAMPEAGTAPGA